MNNVIHFANVQKAFGKKTVLENINLDIPKGTILGLLGKNGAGKTTLIQCALGLLKVTAGEARLRQCIPAGRAVVPWRGKILDRSGGALER